MYKELEKDNDLRAAIDRSMPNAKPEMTPEFMFAYFELLEETHPNYRSAVLWLFRIGFLVIFIPSAFMFIEVVGRTISAIVT